MGKLVGEHPIYENQYFVRLYLISPIDFGWGLMRTYDEFASWVQQREERYEDFEYGVHETFKRAIEAWPEVTNNEKNFDGWRNDLHIGQIPGELSFRTYGARKLMNNGNTVIVIVDEDRDIFDGFLSKHELRKSEMIGI